MPRRYSPNLGESIRLFGDTFTFTQHPYAPGMVFSSEGGRAIVYQVRSGSGGLFGLKVFYPMFRNRNVLDSCKHLVGLERYRGLLAAQRRIVSPDDPQARTIEALQYAVLMPWIPGKTWNDCLAIAGKGELDFTPSVAYGLASGFLDVMSGLENDSVAHTDISAGNVIVNPQQKDTQLLDLEEIFVPGKSQPAYSGPGTLFYQHRSKKSTWTPVGDRYATAVLASEILLSADKSLASMMTNQGFYLGNCESPDATERFKTAEKYLERMAPNFFEIFRVSWYSDSLENCPKICDLREGMAKSVTPTTIFNPPPKRDKRTLIDPLPPEPGPDSSSVVKWVPVEPTVQRAGSNPKPAAPRPAASRPAAPPAGPAVPDVVQWVRSDSNAATNQPGAATTSSKPFASFRVATRSSGRGRKVLLVFAILFVLALLILLFASN